MFRGLKLSDSYRFFVRLENLVKRRGDQELKDYVMVHNDLVSGCSILMSWAVFWVRKRVKAWKYGCVDLDC
jgi:hypothetical protein